MSKLPGNQCRADIGKLRLVLHRDVLCKLDTRELVVQSGHQQLASSHIHFLCSQGYFPHLQRSRTGAYQVLKNKINKMTYKRDDTFSKIKPPNTTEYRDRNSTYVTCSKKSQQVLCYESRCQCRSQFCRQPSDSFANSVWKTQMYFFVFALFRLTATLNNNMYR